MQDPDTVQELSGTSCPSCGCRQLKETMDAVSYTKGVSGINCDTCGNYFTVGAVVHVGFGGGKKTDGN